MIITAASLNALRTGFSAAFANGLGQHESQQARIATTVPSTTKSNTYGWLGKVPNMREWLGPRVIQNLAEHDYTIKNKPFEMTLGVDRDEIEDDEFGVYNPMFTEMGLSTAAHPDQLVFGALKGGFDAICYDGQNFFDTDHPVLDEDGAETTVSNMTAGASTPWFLLSTKRALKPIIFQERKKPEFVAKTAVTDENVFNLKTFVYGVDGRYNVGYGFWQMAHGSKAALNPTNYSAARTAMMSLKGDHGRPLGIVPDLLVVPPTLEGAANKIVKNALAAGGETNEWAGTAEVLVAPWLA